MISVIITKYIKSNYEREHMQEKNDITHGGILLKIIKFILPLMLTGILQLLYNAADSIVVGRWDGSSALAAVSSVGSIINLMINVLMGLAVGTAVAVAHDYGAKDYKGVERTVHTSILVSIVGGVFVGAVGFIFSRTFLLWMQSPENVLPLSNLYLKIYFLGTPANMVYNFGASVLRSVGDTKRPLCFLTISGIVNVLLNLVLVICLDMGVAGVACATIISQYLSAAFVVIYMIKYDGCIHLDWKKLRIHADKLIKIIKVGIPAGFQGALFSISNVLIQSSINSFGDIVMAGNGAAASLEGFTYTAMNSVYQASLTFVGQNVGAHRYDRINRIVFMCVAIVSVIGIVMGGLTCIFDEQLLSIYLPDDPEAIPYASNRLLYVLVPYFLCGIMEVFVGGQRGMGMSVLPMINALIGVCVFRVVWVLTIFAAHRTLEMLYISYPVSWLFSTLAHMCVYFIRLHVIKKRAALVDETKT